MEPLDLRRQAHRLQLRSPAGPSFTVSMAGRRTRIGRSPEMDIWLPDRSGAISREHVVLERRGSAWTATDRSRNGTRLNGRALQGSAPFAIGDELALGGWKLVLVEPGAPQGSTTRPPQSPDEDLLIGRSGALAEVRQRIQRLAPWDLPVLILGETGSGKERVAQAMHRASGRSRRPFVTLNCGALPVGTADAALFGHAKGAFTGADRRRAGIFEQADGGTVFLDEIGELTLENQARLLRVLEAREVTPLGESSRPVDFRLVAATHRDLRAMVPRGTFREDLWFRVHVGSVHIPPLRDRGDDVLLLARYFLGEAVPVPPALAPDAERALLDHRWPGNVRELKNAILRALVLGDGGPIRAAWLALEPQLSLALPEPEPLTARIWKSQSLHASEVVEALRRTRGNRAAAARDLGIARSTLYEHLRRLDDE